MLILFLVCADLWTNLFQIESEFLSSIDHRLITIRLNLPTVFTTITMTETSSYEWKILEWDNKQTNKQTKQTKSDCTWIFTGNNNWRHVQGRVHVYCIVSHEKVKGSTSLFAKCPVVILIRMLNWRRKLYVKIYLNSKTCKLQMIWTLSILYLYEHKTLNRAQDWQNCMLITRAFIFWRKPDIT